MWFSETSFEICVSAAVFYSTFFLSKCTADVSSELVLMNTDEFIHIYRTEVPWKPIPLDGGKNQFAVVAWIAILSVSVSVAVIVCLCCLCWKFYPKRTSRRQSTNVALVPPNPPPTVVTFRPNQDIRSGIRNSRTRTSNLYSRGVMNFAFTSSAEDPGSTTVHPEDVPPAYSSVVPQTFLDNKPTSTMYPPVSEIKKVETPPPAYDAVAPFN